MTLAPDVDMHDKTNLESLMCSARPTEALCMKGSLSLVVAFSACTGNDADESKPCTASETCQAAAANTAQCCGASFDECNYALGLAQAGADCVELAEALCCDGGWDDSCQAVFGEGDQAECDAGLSGQERYCMDFVIEAYGARCTTLVDSDACSESGDSHITCGEYLACRDSL
jgi:hypothetical protein